MATIEPQDLLELAKIVFWLVIVPTFGYLDYYTQIRPYFLSNHGGYLTGFIDGIIVSLSILVFMCYLFSLILV